MRQFVVGAGGGRGGGGRRESEIQKVREVEGESVRTIESLRNSERERER